MLSIQARRHVPTLANLAHFSCANTCVVIQALGVGTACELTFAARGCRGPNWKDQSEVDDRSVLLLKTQGEALEAVLTH
jgi:hypothetical protein